MRRPIWRFQLICLQGTNGCTPFCTARDGYLYRRPVTATRGVPPWSDSASEGRPVPVIVAAFYPDPARLEHRRPCRLSTLSPTQYFLKGLYHVSQVKPRCSIPWRALFPPTVGWPQLALGLQAAFDANHQRP